MTQLPPTFSCSCCYITRSQPGHVWIFFGVGVGREPVQDLFTLSIVVCGRQWAGRGINDTKNKFPGWICYTRAEERQHCCFEMSSVREYFISRPTSQPELLWWTRVQYLNVNIAYRQRFACDSWRYFLTWFYICIFIFCHKSLAVWRTTDVEALKAMIRTLAFWCFPLAFLSPSVQPRPFPWGPYFIYGVFCK